MTEFNLTPFAQKVPKPWGYEVIFTTPDAPYNGKVMHINAGRRLSLHYHEEKLETICLLSGEAVIVLEDASGKLNEIPMEVEKGYTIALNQKHRIITVTDCVVIESAMPEKGLTVRVEDDFSRGDETEELRKEGSRGWNQ